MTIGTLYNANNVAVGQAACLFAPAGTPLPDPSKANFADPFDLSVFGSTSIGVGAATAGTFTLSLAGGPFPAAGVSTAAIPYNAAASVVAAAINAILPAGYSAVVTGAASPWSVYIAGPGSEEAITISGSGTGLTGGAFLAVPPLWTPTGATDQGWQFGANKTTTDIAIEEQSTPAAKTIASQQVTISGSLSEDISQTLALAYNGTLTTNLATTTEPTWDEINPTDSVIYYAVCLITATPVQYPRWYYAPTWAQLNNATTDFRRSANKHMYPVSFSTVCQPGQIRILNFKKPHN